MASLRCTVVVIATHGGRSLEACLTALVAQGAACMAMLGAGTGSAASWRTRFPSVRFVDAAALSVPWRRMRGIATADTELVALLEDSSVPQARWSAAIADAFTAPAVAAVGGPVAIGVGLSHRQQALACCEYGRFHPAAMHRLALGREGERSGAFDVARLPGNNVAYRKAALQGVCGEDEPLLETQANAALLAAGGRLQVHPDMAVEYRPEDDRGTRLGERFRHGRLYAGVSAQGASAGRRAWRLLKAFLLPLVLSSRGLRAMRTAVRPAAWWAVGAWVCCMETAWAAGEAVGYLAGPGRTLDAWH
jgi:hypothetical protein